jgi:RNA polymerase sigma-70 factor, ECF subfamily
VSGELETLSELELLCQAQAGMADSFGVLTERYKPALLRYLGCRVPRPEDAEDLAQETISRAFANLDSFQRGRPFAAWLFTIATHVAVTFLRTPRQRTNADEFEQVKDCCSTAEEKAIQRELCDGLWMKVQKLLPPMQWRALWLRYGQSLPVREIAGALGLNAIHVKVLLFRARRRLAASEEFFAAFGDNGPAGHGWHSTSENPNGKRGAP